MYKLAEVENLSPRPLQQPKHPALSKMKSFHLVSQNNGKVPNCSENIQNKASELLWKCLLVKATHHQPYLKYTWVVQSEQHASPNPGAVSSSPMLGIEIS